MRGGGSREEGGQVVEPGKEVEGLKKVDRGSCGDEGRGEIGEKSSGKVRVSPENRRISVIPKSVGRG